MSRAIFAVVARECDALEVARDFAGRGERVLSHRHALVSKGNRRADVEKSSREFNALSAL